MGQKAPKANSTGTTIVAVTYKVYGRRVAGPTQLQNLQDGVVMGADSRATAGNVIADKHCEKVRPATVH